VSVRADRGRPLADAFGENTDQLELGDGSTLSEYLYAELDTAFPIHRMVAEVVEAIRRNVPIPHRVRARFACRSDPSASVRKQI
jgi:hypothetical protein